MEFSGYLRNSIYENSRGLVKKEIEFPGLIKKKLCEISGSLGV